MRSDAARVDRKRKQGDHEQHFEPDVLQLFVEPEIAEQHETQRGHRADGGHVVDDEVQVGQVHGTTYARRRPAVIAPLQARIDAIARRRILLVTSRCSAPLPSTSERIGTTVAALAMTRPILTKNGNAVPQCVGSLMNSRMPVTMLTQRPTASVGKTQRYEDRGTFRPMPSRRRSNT